jgi:tetratricopeptide (TPR) repeat protein
LAWLRATCPEAPVRNGAEAVALAQRAVQLLGGSNADCLDTLAAAYAEAGHFTEAEQTARKALDLATQQKKRALAESIEAKIRLYAAGIPFHESPSSPAETSPRP